MIPSPCINLCQMQGDVCAGCFRTLDEIRAWGNASDDEKTATLDAVSQRRARRSTASGASGTLSTSGKHKHDIPAA